MDELTPDQLRTLYFNFVAYRDKRCNGRADMSVHEFYRRYGLREVPQLENQK